MSRTVLVDWDDQDRTRFERIVEALLYRMHEGHSDVTVVAYDGRGGDGGRDVAVRRGDDHETIYQLKHFREGFSGAWGKSRKPQVRKSFESAMAHRPKRWVLVIPRNPTPAEEKWVRSLRGKRKGLVVEIFGRAGLDAELARFPDLLDAFVRDHLVATLKEVGLEDRALTTDEHLNTTLADLRRRIDGRSAYWGLDVTVGHRGTIKQLYAKDPRAPELEPISIHLTTIRDQLTPEAHERLEAFFAYGSNRDGKIVIPTEAVAEFRVEGPEWIAQEGSGAGQVEIHALSEEDARHVVEVRAIDIRGVNRASLRGESTDKGSGYKGLSLNAAFPGGLALEFLFSINVHDPGEMKVQHNLVGEDAVDVRRDLRFITSLAESDRFELWIDGSKLGTMATGATSNRPDIPDDSQLLADDLATIATEFDVPLQIPEELRGVERAAIRSARLLLDGHCVLVPELTGITVTLTGENNDAIEKWIRTPSTIRIGDDMQYMIQGHNLSIPEVWAFHPTVRALNGQEAIRVLREGAGEGFRLQLEPTDGTPFRAFIPSRLLDPKAPLVPVQLDVPGLPEHPALAKITRNGKRAAEHREPTHDRRDD